ncbi:MAG: hypothetical protein LBV54_04930 [Puniceicoccales bacterium]|jgi:hypothetical protein|nr:hypothetical protein [Puniceicoccales bacterium]
MSETNPPTSSAPAAHSTNLVVLPVPGWLFFLETLPLADTAAAAVEDTVKLSLESHAPLPVEQLAYGWRLDPVRKTLLYYAAARDRVRQNANGIYDKAGFLLPDFVLAPRKSSGFWHWLATPGTLTAVRFQGETAFPVEVHSWPLLVDDGRPLEELAREARATREAQCPGAQTGTVWCWGGASVSRDGKTLNIAWTSASDGPLTVELPVEEAWHADVRERSLLTGIRRERAGALHIRRFFLSAAAAWAALLVGGGLLHAYKSSVQAEAAQIVLRQMEADEIISKRELLSKLDDMESGQVSFYDALAALSHYRGTNILFSNASANSKGQIQVSGTATTIAQVDDYVKALRDDGSFAKVEKTRDGIAGRRVTFDLRVTVGNLSVARRNRPPTIEEVEAMVNAVMRGAGTPASVPALALPDAEPKAGGQLNAPEQAKDEK